MSRENVEIVRRGYEALRAGNLSGVLDLLHPSAEIRSARESPDGGVSIGHAGLLSNFSRAEESFDELHYEPEELLDAGDRVVVFVRMRARGRTSGLVVDDRLAHVWTLRDGKGIALDIHRDRLEALDAAGLRA